MTIANGYNRFERIAADMREAITNGAAATPERVSVRELVGWFGYQKRGDQINNHIRNGMEKAGLRPDRDPAVVWLDAVITIELDYEDPNMPRPQQAPDPTHRIGALEAANNRPMHVAPDSPLRAATTIMQLHDYSQLPVMSGEYNVKGIITWKSIGTRLAIGRECEFVRQCMEPAEILPVTAPLFEAIGTIAEHGYVLVRGQNNAICGIVTAADLSYQFMNLAGPFLFVGEIEGHLRHLIHGKFTIDEIRAAALPGEGRDVDGPAGLTLGEYCRLLEGPENWKRLKLNIDRAEFVKHLHQVRDIRNDVMHFNPDGLSEEDKKALRGVARFFGDLVRMGAM